MGGVRWTESEVKLLISLYHKHSANEIAEKLGKKVDAIYFKAQMLGLKRKSCKVNIKKVKSGSFMVFFASKYLGCFKEERFALQAISEHKQLLNKE